MNLRIALISLAAVMLSATVTATPLTEKADSAYSADRFEEASALYRKVMAEEGVSATLYYNLGNAEYRQGHLGQAILNYERALRLNPSYDDARTNLDFVNSRIADRPGERGTFIGNALDAVANNATTNTWAWMAFAAFLITCGLVALYVFSIEVKFRKTGFFGAIATLVLTVISVYFAVRAASIATDTRTAIITSSSTILSTSPRQPRNRAEEAMLLHEGTKLMILDSVKSVTDSVPSTWLDVEIDNSHRAWVNSRDVERVR